MRKGPTNSYGRARPGARHGAPYPGAVPKQREPPRPTRRWSICDLPQPDHKAPCAGSGTGK
eukprot:8587827-Lingulodinium_polyedra.AAC.1